jgi:hypothetical protein
MIVIRDADEVQAEFVRQLQEITNRVEPDDDDWAPFCTYCLHHHPLEQTCAQAGENL